LVHQWRWRLTIWSDRLDVIGRLGLGLVVLAGTVYLTAVMPAHWDMEEREATIASMQERAAQEARRLAQTPTGPGDELDRFYRILPPDTKASDPFRMIYRIGLQQGLQLEQAEYRVAMDGQGRLFRYEMAFPVIGTYPQIRMFLRHVSSEVPSAAPDKVDFEYQDKNDGRVRATIRLLIYTRNDS